LIQFSTTPRATLFFTSEVIRHLSERGELLTEDGAALPEIRIPEGVREVIGQRLNRLSEHCNQTLTVASVIGREFSLALLKLLMKDLPDGRLLEVLDEGLAASVIEELPQTVGVHQFSHALIQETLAIELSATRRANLHARIGEDLEELYGDDSQSHAPELAYHCSEAEAVTGPDKLVHYSSVAAEQSMAIYAYEDALGHFERGLVARDIAVSGPEAAPDEEAAALLFGLARARSATLEGHQLGDAFATLSRAFEYYADVGNIAMAVAAAEFTIASPTWLIPGVAQLIARALILVPADSHEAGRLLSRYGAALGVGEGDYEGAQQALGRAISIAKREGDVPLEVQTLSYAATVSGQHLYWQESVDNGLRAMELATGDEKPFSDFNSRWWTGISLLYKGDPDAARPHVSVLLDLAERRSTPRAVASNGYSPITYLSCLEGDWKAGRGYSGLGLEVSPLNPILLLLRIMLEHETGEAAQGEVYLERLLEAMRRSATGQFFASVRVAMAISAVARITGVPGRLEIAEAAAEAVLSEPSLTQIYSAQAKAGLALLAVQEGDECTAAGHYADLLGQRSTMIQSVSSVDRLLGLLSKTMGKVEQAESHFEDAMGFCRKAGYRPELAWTCHDYAEALLVGARHAVPLQAHREKAIALLDESLAIATELGMRPLMERAAALKDTLGTRPTARTAYPDGLTQREVEVIQLVAAGKTDREIAEELIISVNTVGNHVRSILNKTSAANRTEAAAYAALRGLTAGAGETSSNSG